MAISLPDARQLSDEVLQSLRLRALRGCELGYSEIEVAELLGLSRETVSRWWTAYVDHGLEALPGDRTGRPVGSGRTLNDGQAARLRTILNEKSPEEVGIASPLWTRRAAGPPHQNRWTGTNGQFGIRREAEPLRHMFASLHDVCGLFSRLQ